MLRMLVALLADKIPSFIVSLLPLYHVLRRLVALFTPPKTDIADGFRKGLVRTKRSTAFTGPATILLWAAVRQTEEKKKC